MTRNQCETIGHTWYRKTCNICGAFDPDREFDPELEPIVRREPAVRVAGGVIVDGNARARVARQLGAVSVPAQVLGAPASCYHCGISSREKPLDLDVQHDPPELSCRRCLKRPLCKSCNKRKNRLTVEPGRSEPRCCACVRASAREEKKREIVRCKNCNEKTNIMNTNEHGECASCATDRLYREHPITRSNA